SPEPDGPPSGCPPTTVSSPTPGSRTSCGWRRPRCTRPTTTAGGPPQRWPSSDGEHRVGYVSGDDGVAVVGAGLAGCLLACYLARRGLRVRLYERRADPRHHPPERGRSINLAISERGLTALSGVGLAERVLAEAIAMRGRMIHAVDRPRAVQRYSAAGTRASHAAGRAALTRGPLAAAVAAGAEVHFGRRLVGLDPSTGRMRFATPAGERKASADVVLGAERAGSAVRGQL